MPEEETNQFVVFKLGNEEYGVDVMHIKEIARTTTITWVPRSPSFIDGVFNLRGRLATVINLRKRFGFEPKKIDADTRIVIAELEDKPIGMLVDAATEVLKIPVSDIETTPEMVTTEISKDYLKGVGKVGNRIIILLDIRQVLTKKEIEEIGRFEERKSVKKLEKEIEEEKEAKTEEKFVGEKRKKEKEEEKEVEEQKKPEEVKKGKKK